ncbi:hypothetical protein [Bdellovibrio bacteriovorus]|uniref:hypothetical protein n=1 Tax=Bdellovibrio bacteriovorus TaxID=959 RepID=UPI0035A5977E
MTTLFLLSSTAQATVSGPAEIGVYVGKTDKNAPCELEISRVYREGAIESIFTLRLSAKVNGENFVLAVPPELKEESGEVLNSHKFVGLNPSTTGARALVVKFERDPKSKAYLDEYILLDHQPRSGRAVKSVATGCYGLKLRK